MALWNDVLFQMLLLEINDNDEVLALRWLFIPRSELNHRTPMEVISDGGRDRVIQVMGELNEK